MRYFSKKEKPPRHLIVVVPRSSLGPGERPRCALSLPQGRERASSRAIADTPAVAAP
jgi:hypothetical protein